MRQYTFLLLVIFSISLSSCLTVPERTDGPLAGRYRAVLKLDGLRRPLNKDAKPENRPDLKFQEVTNGELPFLFDLEYVQPKQLKMSIYNADETITTKDITYGWNRATGDDSIRINFPHYDSYITALFEEGVIEGSYVVTTKNGARVPFVAKFGQGHLFSTNKKKPLTDVSGKWKVTFGIDTDKTWDAIGEFKQDGNRVTGTFLTETGDYRYLDGTIQDNKMYLSTFDGSHAFLFEMKLSDENNLTGSFRSGSWYKTLFSGKRDDSVELKNPEDLTYLKKGYDKFDFSFPNTNGKTLSLSDKQFENKYKIVQILGTWCPNCADETKFLKEFLETNKRDDIAVIGLAFEKHKEEQKAFRAINIFKQRFGIDYPVLWAGSSRKSEAAKQLPMLNDIISYPTMLILDKNNKVLKIHTGFNGPATSKYKQFATDFKTFISKLP